MRIGRVGVLLLVTSGLALGTAQLAAAASRPTGPTPTGRVCVVRATMIVRAGTVNIVRASATTCYSSHASYLRAQASAADAPRANVNVGYGCDLQNFSPSDTCWYFAVPSPGCTSHQNWVWNGLGAMNNDMQSWESLTSCRSGRVFSLPYQTGHSVDCESACNSLGSSVNNHDESLLAAYSSEP